MTTTSFLGSHNILAMVATTDAARAKAFYGGTLGLALLSEDSFASVFDAHGISLRVSNVRELTPAKYTVLGWEVPDVAAAVAVLRSAGVQFEHYGFKDQDESGVWTAPGGVAKVAWFKDPDGNILSVSHS